jgi:hypothetical protein
VTWTVLILSSTNLPDDTVDHVGEALAPPITAGLSRMKG